jgi:hypothetical protein
MYTRMHKRHLLASWATLVFVACSHPATPDAPLAPSGGGGGRITVGTGTPAVLDSGPSADAGDAAVSVSSYCVAINPSTRIDAGALPSAIPDASTSLGGAAFDAAASAFLDGGAAAATQTAFVTTPTDFRVTRALMGWSGPCGSSDVLIELSDGTCAAAGAHRLQFYVSAAAVAAGQVHIGTNAVLPVPDSTGIRVSYLRPKSVTPSGAWGSCTGETGQLLFLANPDVTNPSRLQASFLLELTACGSSMQGPLSVEGYFDLMLLQTLSRVCP